MLDNLQDLESYITFLKYLPTILSFFAIFDIIIFCMCYKILRELKDIKKRY